MANAIDPLQKELEEARKRYDYPFDKALAAGVPIPEILEEVRTNRPELTSYRLGRSLASKFDTTNKDIGDVIESAPRKAWELTPAGYALKKIGDISSRVLPDVADQPLAPAGRRVEGVISSIDDRLGPVAGGVAKSVADTISGLTTPKSVAIATSMLTPAAPVVGAALLPEMVLGGWESGVKGTREALAGHPREAAEQLTTGALSGAMALGLAKAGGAKLEAMKVAREVERGRLIESKSRDLENMVRMNTDAKIRTYRNQAVMEDAFAKADAEARAKAAEEIRDKEVPGVPGVAATMEMPLAREATRKITRLSPEGARPIVEAPLTRSLTDLILPREEVGVPGVAATMEMPLAREATRKITLPAPAGEAIPIANKSLFQLLNEMVGNRRGSFSTKELSPSDIARRAAIEREIARRGKAAVESGAEASAPALAPALAQKPQVSDVVAPEAIKEPKPSTGQSAVVFDTLHPDYPHPAEIPDGKAHPSLQVARDAGGAWKDSVRTFDELKKNQPGPLSDIHSYAHDQYYAAQKGFADSLKGITEEAKAIPKATGLKINKYVDRLIREYGEGTLDEQDLVTRVGNTKARKIMQADKMFTSLYDKAWDQMAASLEQAGMDVPKKLPHYYRHLYGDFGDVIGGLKEAMGKEEVAKIIEKITGTGEIGPGGGKASILRRRGKGEANIGAMEGFINYAPQWAWQVNMPRLAPMLDVVRQDISTLAGGRDVAKAQLPNTLKFYDKLQRDVLHQKNKFDQLAEQMVDMAAGKKGVKVYTAMKKASGAIIRNTMNSLSPIITNTAAAVNAAGEFHLTDAIKGAANTIGDVLSRGKPSDASQFLNERFAEHNLRGLSAKFMSRHNPISTAFEINDKAISTFAWNMAKAQADRVKAPDPVRYADEMSAKILGDRSKLGKAEVYDSEIGRQLLPGTLEVNNLQKQMAGYLKGKKGTEASRATAAWKLTKVVMASNIVNDLIEKALGYRPVVDPLHALAAAANAETVGQAVGLVVAEIANGYAIGNAASQLVPDRWRREMFGKEDPGRYGIMQMRPVRAAYRLGKAAFTGEGEHVGRDITDLLTSFSPRGIPGAQVRKTLKGYDLVQNEGRMKAGNEDIQIPMDDWNKLQALILGPQSLGEYQEATRGRR